MQQIDQAVAGGDAVAARLALEEARELRPDAPDLDDVAERVALIPVAHASARSTDATWLRPMRAVSLLAAGIALVVGIEWVRPPRPLPSSRAIVPTVATVLPPAATIATPEQDSTVASATPANTVVASTEPDLAISDPVGTGGVEPAINTARPAVGGPATASFRPQALIETGLQERAREIRDLDPAADARGQREANADTPETASVLNAVADASAQQQPARVEDDRRASAERVPERAAAPPALVASMAPVPAPIGLIAPVRPNPALVEARTRMTEESRIAQVLDQYARAYGTLDVRAARKVWPSVDERALARAFAGLQSQDVSFDNCNVSVSGATAIASCRGRTTYVGKIGNRDKRSESRQWTFELRREGADAWQIERAQAQRMAQQDR